MAIGKVFPNGNYNLLNKCHDALERFRIIQGDETTSKKEKEKSEKAIALNHQIILLNTSKNCL